jgi:outer membrane scaffolding protein for murein synthesis (MipA/OmpV family)
MKLNTIVFAMLISAMPGKSFADDERDWSLMLGGIIASDNMPWNGYKTQTRAFPYIDFRSGNFFFSAEQGLGYNLQITEELIGYTSISYRDDSYNDNGLLLSTMHEHQVFDGYNRPSGEALINIGLEAYYLSFTMSQDISDKSDSMSASLGFSLPFIDIGNNFSTKLNGSVSYYDKKYVNHYYGVPLTNINTLVARVAYTTEKSTLNYDIGLTALYSFADSWTLLASGSYTTLGKEIYSSPLLNGRKWYASAAVGVAYAF